VLATDHEYGALDKTWTFVCARRGARDITAPLPLPLQAPAHVVDAVWSRVTPRTRMPFLSHTTSPTALILPVEALARRAREAGLLTVVDGAHAPGQIPLDVRGLGVDFYAGNCHKWMCAPSRRCSEPATPSPGAPALRWPRSAGCRRSRRTRPRGTRR
jgi:isopenicillin-N epimerase